MLSKLLKTFGMKEDEAAVDAYPHGDMAKTKQYLFQFGREIAMSCANFNCT